jgi:RNA polymerase sigma factor (sigma-70 family)
MADNGDAELLARYLADRSTTNRDALVRNWTEYAVRVVVKVLKSRGIKDADVARELALHSTWRAVECYDPENAKHAKFRSYLHTRCALKAKQYVPPDQDGGEVEDEPEEGQDAKPEEFQPRTVELSGCETAPDPMPRTDAQEFIRVVLGRIKPKYALVLRMRYIEGMTIQEVGDKLGVSRQRADEVLRLALASAQRAQKRGGTR